MIRTPQHVAFVTLIASAVCAVASADTAVLTSVADNTIIEDAAGAYSGGGAQYFFVGRVGVNGSSLLRRGALRFDFSSIPAGAIVTSVTLRMSQRTCEHNGDPAKKYPRNKETADHSCYFITALGIVTRGRVTPASFNDAAYQDPIILDLIDKVQIEHGPEYDAIPPAAQVTIVTRDGRKIVKRVDTPRGNADNRMSDDELRDKFIGCADGRMPYAQVDRIVETCLSLEKLDDIGDLMPLLALPQAADAAP